RSRLRSALSEAAATNTTVVVWDARVKRGRSYDVVHLTVIPTIGSEEPLFLVAFEDERKAPKASRGGPRERSLVKHLEDELHATREDLRASVEGLETSNEE